MGGSQQTETSPGHLFTMCCYELKISLTTTTKKLAKRLFDVIRMGKMLTILV